MRTRALKHNFSVWLSCDAVNNVQNIEDLTLLLWKSSKEYTRRGLTQLHVWVILSLMLNLITSTGANMLSAAHQTLLANKDKPLLSACCLGLSQRGTLQPYDANNPPCTHILRPAVLSATLTFIAAPFTTVCCDPILTFVKVLSLNSVRISWQYHFLSPRTK